MKIILVGRDATVLAEALGVWFRRKGGKVVVGPYRNFGVGFEAQKPEAEVIATIRDITDFTRMDFASGRIYLFDYLGVVKEYEQTDRGLRFEVSILTLWQPIPRADTTGVPLWPPLIAEAPRKVIVIPNGLVTSL